MLICHVLTEIAAGRRRLSQHRKPPSPILEKRRSGMYTPDDILNNGPSPSAVTAFPPPPNAFAPPLSASPSRGNTLTRVLSMASKRLVKTATRAPSYFLGREQQQSPRRSPLILGKSGEEGAETIQDPLEGQLLVELEVLAQETHVLTKWADEMYEYVKAVPKSVLRSYVFFNSSTTIN